MAPAGAERRQLAVMRKGPVLPKFTTEGVGIRQLTRPTFAWRIMDRSRSRFDRVALDQLRNGRTVARLRIIESSARAAAFIGSHAQPSQCGPVRPPRCSQAGETEADNRLAPVALMPISFTLDYHLPTHPKIAGPHAVRQLARTPRPRSIDHAAHVALPDADRPPQPSAKGCDWNALRENSAAL